MSQTYSRTYSTEYSRYLSSKLKKGDWERDCAGAGTGGVDLDVEASELLESTCTFAKIKTLGPHIAGNRE